MIRVGHPFGRCWVVDAIRRLPGFISAISLVDVGREKANCRDVIGKK